MGEEFLKNDFTKLEENVNQFIYELKKFDKSQVETTTRKIFNPWENSDSTDISEEASQIRCKNLYTYLIEHKNPDLILIAESPSTGARYTGIPMTSEKVIQKYNLNYEYTSCKYKSYKRGESTALKVWNEIMKSKKNIVFWNAFAFNICTKTNKWFETPNDNELVKNKYILEMFLNIYPNCNKVVAVGNTARKALIETLQITNIEFIRHPSNDYEKQFAKQIKKYL